MSKKLKNTMIKAQGAMQGKALGLEKQTAGEIATKSQAANHAQGKGVVAKQEAATKATAPTVQSPKPKPLQPMSFPPPAKKKKSKSKWLWIVLFIAAIAVAAYFLVPLYLV